MTQRSSFRIVAAALLTMAVGPVVTPLAAATVNGPIRVSADGRHFADRDGRPFFWLGRHGLAALRAVHEGAGGGLSRQPRPEGLHRIQGVLAWGLGSGFEGKTPLANANGDKPWLNDDPRTPNDAYFRHVDALVEFANQQGLVLAMLPTWGYYVNDVPVIDAAKARAYGRWLGARYKSAPNVIWVNGGDRDAPPASRTSTASWRAACARATAAPTSSPTIPAAGARRRSTSTAKTGWAST